MRCYIILYIIAKWKNYHCHKKLQDFLKQKNDQTHHEPSSAFDPKVKAHIEEWIFNDSKILLNTGKWQWKIVNARKKFCFCALIIRRVRKWQKDY
jgi:hypothetical protein